MNLWPGLASGAVGGFAVGRRGMGVCGFRVTVPGDIGWTMVAVRAQHAARLPGLGGLMSAILLILWDL